jgi:hypothetical protein
MTPPKKARRRNPTPSQTTTQQQAASNTYTDQQQEPTTSTSIPLNNIDLVALQASNQALNLSVLRRYIPDILAIITTAPYAVLYIFSPHSSAWEKSGIEGTLFVIACTPDEDTGAERFKAVLLNRRGLENFSAELRHPDDVDITDDYVIIKGDDDEDQIFGLWIFAEPAPASTAHMRELTGSIIIECAKRAAVSRDQLAGTATAAVPEEEEEEQEEPEPEPEPEPESANDNVLPGRQVSLVELFGRQREADSGFSVHNHHSVDHIPSNPDQGLIPPPSVDAAATTSSAANAAAAVPRDIKPQQTLFDSNPDTDFFRAGKLSGLTPMGGTPVQNGAHGGGVSLTAGGSIAVEELFRAQRLRR